MDKQKDIKIKNEIKRLTGIFEEIHEDKKTLISKLIDNAAFMAITLEDLQDRINNDGPIIKSTNGNGFEVISEHPAQKSYNTMINRYTSTINQLTNLLPSDKETSVSQAGDALAAFIAKGKPTGRGSK